MVLGGTNGTFLRESATNQTQGLSAVGCHVRRVVAHILSMTEDPSFCFLSYFLYIFYPPGYGLSSPVHLAVDLLLLKPQLKIVIDWLID